MAEIKGTSGPDIVVVQSGDLFRGEEGDDHITLVGWSTGEGGPGNDVLIADSSSRKGEATARYWSSSNPILVDLGQGYALDGFGGRDQLNNIYTAHGFKRDGDQGLGSSQADSFWVGPWQNHTGTIRIDGRQGNDKVTIGYNLQDNRGDLVFQASADGKLVRVHLSNQPNLVIELRNIETIHQWLNLGNNQSRDTTTSVSSLIDLSQAGEQILVRGGKGLQSGANGSPVAISYSFLDKAPATGAEGGSGFQPFSSAQQQTTRAILERIAQLTGITFHEVAADSGQIRFGINQQSNTRGYSFLPDDHPMDAKASDVWLDVETALLMQPGQEGYYVLLHELAHALGLRHPLPESDSSGQTVLLDQFSSFAYTLMLDLTSAQNTAKAWPSWYGFFDMQALRHLYGSKPYATGDDTYRIGNASGDASVLLIDDAGMDTLDISSSQVSGSIDLRPGKVSSAGMNPDGIAYFANLSIAPDTWIEKLVATRFDDYILGNSLDNLIWSAGGNDIILGESGADVVVLTGRSGEWVIRYDPQNKLWNAQASNGEAGSVELHAVERLHFADGGVALDMDPSGSPARVAKILGAVFGAEAVNNQAYAGIGLYFFENLRYSYDQLMQLAIDARLGNGSSDPRSVVDLLYTNLIGQAPTDAEARPYVDMLVNDTISVAGLGLLAAETGRNIQNIDLVGLSETGFHFGF